MKFPLLTKVISLAVLAVMLASAAVAQDSKSFILTTATTGGTYYPVGVALSTLTKLQLKPETGISLSAISSAGSAENLKLLREGEAQFALLQGLYGVWAWNGTGRVERDGPQRHLRSITALWENVEHFVLERDLAATKSIRDLSALKGQKFSVGNRNSGAEGSTNFILNTLGLNPLQSFSPVYQGYGPSADALQNGTIAGMSTPAGLPVSVVMRALSANPDGFVLLSFADQDIERLNKSFTLWSRFVIPASTYPGQSADVASISHPNFLAVHADINQETVYQITKLFYENLPYLRAIHKATSKMSLERALIGLPVPLHPGAAQYYEEAALTIPDSLRVSGN